MAGSPIDFLSPPDAVRAATGDAGALGAWLTDVMAQCRPRLVVIDTFVRGIRGELDRVAFPAGVRRACCLRHTRAEVAEADRYADVIRAHYDGVVFCEDSPVLMALAAGLGPVPQVRTAPILIRDGDELSARAEAFGLLGVAPGRRVCLAVVTGARSDGAWLAGEVLSLRKEVDGAEGWEFVVAGCEPPPGGGACDHWPLMEVLPAVSLLVGPAGYNLFHEAGALGVPAIWLPVAKQVDDQLWRARGGRAAASRPELLQLVRRALREGVTLGNEGGFENGAYHAAAFFARLISAAPAP